MKDIYWAESFNHTWTYLELLWPLELSGHKLLLLLGWLWPLELLWLLGSLWPLELLLLVESSRIRKVETWCEHIHSIYRSWYNIRSIKTTLWSLTVVGACVDRFCSSIRDDTESTTSAGGWVVVVAVSWSTAFWRMGDMVYEFINMRRSKRIVRGRTQYVSKLRYHGDINRRIF